MCVRVYFYTHIYIYIYTYIYSGEGGGTGVSYGGEHSVGGVGACVEGRGGAGRARSETPVLPYHELEEGAFRCDC